MHAALPLPPRARPAGSGDIDAGLLAGIRAEILLFLVERGMPAMSHFAGAVRGPPAGAGDEPVAYPRLRALLRANAPVALEVGWTLGLMG